jgi:MFS family permease
MWSTSSRHGAPTGRSPWVTLAPACLGYFFVLLDVTIVNVSLADMGRDLGTTREGLQWVVDGYALVLASLMLSAGDVADLFGRRRVFLGGSASGRHWDRSHSSLGRSPAAGWSTASAGARSSGSTCRWWRQR